MNLEHEKKPPSLTREHILQAAGRQVMSEGASGLTLEAVAKNAGISKGGLLYHFPSKEALILGMIDAHFEWIKQVILEEKSRLPHPEAPGAWHRAFVEASFKNFVACNDLSAGMLAVVSQDSMLAGRIQQGLRELGAVRAGDGIPPVVSNLVVSTLDGIKIHQVVGMPMLSEQEAGDLRNLLFRLIDEGVQACAIPAKTHRAPPPNQRESA